MISKEEFTKYLECYQTFDKATLRLEEAICGKKYGCNLYESDWCQSVGKMLDTFLESHFTDEGCDLINAYLFESNPLVIYEQANLFEDRTKIQILNLSQLWDFLSSDIKTFFK